MTPEEKISYMKEVVEDIYEHSIHQYAYRFLHDGAKLFAAQVIMIGKTRRGDILGAKA